MSDFKDTVRETYYFLTGYSSPKEEIDDDDEYKDASIYEEDISLECYQHKNKIKKENELENIAGESPDEEFQCNFCNNPIVGYRYACVQCANYEICSMCESREVHALHYMLRVPGFRSYTEIQSILEVIRTHLYSTEILLKPFDDKPNSDDSLLKPNSEDLILKPNHENLIIKPNGDDFLLKPSNDNYILKTTDKDFSLKQNQDTNESRHSSVERSSNDLKNKEHPTTEPKVKNAKVHIKKPLNAFMLYMKEMRPSVFAECEQKHYSTVNQILGKRWHALSGEEQAKYYDMALQEQQLHKQLYPNWSVKKVKKRRKKKNFLKCRGKYGIDQRHLWCQPCLRKKKCQQFSEASPTAEKALQISTNKQLSQKSEKN